tara:strand:+ start:544 stop:933 length:390 start_codon:yes stop_codon:yes gene_type:complete
MATSKTTINSPLYTTKFTDTDASPGSSASKVEVSTSSPTNVGEIFIDNSVKASKMYLKLYNAATGSVTVGTTDPHLILTVEASSTVKYTFVPNMVFSSGCTYSLVTTAGTAGTTGANVAGIKVEILMGS